MYLLEEPYVDVNVAYRSFYGLGQLCLWSRSQKRLRGLHLAPFSPDSDLVVMT